ncbi:MAG: prenyltransferase [Bacteroidales bacterium]
MTQEKTTTPGPESSGSQPPGLLQMIRAPFLSSIIAPLLAGTLLSVSINGYFLPLNFLLMLIIGIGLHAAVNVYNDIYDTLQGTDAVNEHRNESSGGSGILQSHPELMGRMFFIARSALVMALIASVLLLLFIKEALWPHLIILFLLSAFFSKYYTAPPFKLAYRGLGEVSVWFAFGPMAIMIAAVSQNIGFHPYVIALMPATGLSTSSILLVGQMIDIDADRKGGKHGVASRLGTRAAALIYLLVQALIVANMIYLSVYLDAPSWPVLLAVLPYLFIFPAAARIIYKHHDQPDELKKGAKLTVLIHLAFSLLLIAGLALRLL